MTANTDLALTTSPKSQVRWCDSHSAPTAKCMLMAGGGYWVLFVVSAVVSTKIGPHGDGEEVI